MITNDETTQLQLAVEANDLDAFRELIAPHSGADLSELQLFSNHTLFMYACERCSPEIVGALLNKGVTFCELEWSDNNELKSILRNPNYAESILRMVLPEMLPELAQEMISSDWDPDPDSKDKCESPLEMAAKLSDRSCHRMLTDYLKNS